MATTTTTPSSTLTSLSSSTLHRFSLLSLSKPRSLSLSKPRPHICLCTNADTPDPTPAPPPPPPANMDVVLFRNKDDPLGPDEDASELSFDPPEKPYGFVPPRAVDEPPFESDEDTARAYEELYGPGYSGETFLGNDVYVMDSKFKKKTSGFSTKGRRERIRDGLEENVVQVRRVTKVVKGGKNMRFRALVVVGDKKGRVGVGIGKARDVSSAVQKAGKDARRHLVTVPMTKYLTFPHRAEADYGAARVMLRPAAPGTGVIAGGAVRTVLEMAGVQNALGKQLGSNNAINNARATVVAVQSMRQFSEVAEQRGIPMEQLWK